MAWKCVLCAVAFLTLGALGEFNVTKDVTFRLFTENNKFDWINLGFNLRNLTDAGFNFNRDTKIVTHGFLNNGSGMSCIAVRDAYLQHYDLNVIIIDYAPIGNSLITPATEKIALVGEYVGLFIDFLLQQGYSGSRLHLIGHSLGGHVIGHAARRTTRGRVARVSALDPAMMTSDPVRLDNTVADFVDVIHTARGIFGMLTSLGHVDFYPNGGLDKQPSCKIVGSSICSHYEAVRYFVRSIHDPRRYPAVECNSMLALNLGNCRNNPKNWMGVDATPNARGDFYLTTADEGDSLTR